MEIIEFGFATQDEMEKTIDTLMNELIESEINCPVCHPENKKKLQNFYQLVDNQYKKVQK